MRLRCASLSALQLQIIFLGKDMFYLAVEYGHCASMFTRHGAFGIDGTFAVYTNLICVPKIKFYFTV